MKCLLYIGRPNLGENLFATPCMELLSKEYDITLLIPNRAVPAFIKYGFLKKVITYEELPYVIDTLTKTGDWYYAYHHDQEEENFKDRLKDLGVKRLPVLHDKEIGALTRKYKKLGGYMYLSRTRKYMLKLQLMPLEETDNFDCTVRCPTVRCENETNTIVVYQGSKEKLRMLPTETISKFASRLPNATFLVSKNTADALRLNELGINCILTDPTTHYSLTKIIKLFESGPKVMIGPDSGLTQLATGYKIPLIWLRSRIALESVIDQQYKKYYKIYSRTNLECGRNCFGCISEEELNTNVLPYGLFEIAKKYVDWKELKCPTANCLEYTETEIEDIIKLISM